MEIICFIKQVPDNEAQVEVKGNGTGVNVEERYGLNFFDSLAVEEALRIKEKAGGKVTAITLGPERSVEVLRTAIAMGVDEAHLISDSSLQERDEVSTARVLAEAAKKIGYDLILCGREAFDDSSGAVGPMVAEFLGIPAVSVVTRVEVHPEERKAVVEREMEGGKEEIELPLPALLTAQKGLNEPRVPPVMGVMKAMKAEIKRWSLEDLGLDAEEVAPRRKIIRYVPPPKRPPVRYIKGEPQEMAKELVELLRDEAKVI